METHDNDAISLLFAGADQSAAGWPDQGEGVRAPCPGDDGHDGTEGQAGGAVRDGRAQAGLGGLLPQAALPQGQPRAGGKCSIVFVAGVKV